MIASGEVHALSAMVHQHAPITCPRGPARFNLLQGPSYESDSAGVHSGASERFPGLLKSLGVNGEVRVVVVGVLEQTHGLLHLLACGAGQNSEMHLPRVALATPENRKQPSSRSPHRGGCAR